LLEREVLDLIEVNLLLEGKPLPEKQAPPAAPLAAAPSPRAEPKPVPGFAKGEKPAPA